MIKLYPKNGLCNRMRAIDSAIALANQTGRELVVFWEKNIDLNSSFSDLFEPIKGIKMVECERYPFLFWKSNIRNLYLPDIVRKIFYGHYYDAEGTKKLGENHHFKEITKDRAIIINSCTRFYQNPSKYKNFKPVPEILEEIERETALFNEETIGVHIRRTDNQKAIANSPLNLFIEAMQQEIELNPSANFYVASDDMEVKLDLKRIFGNKIYTNQEVVTRDSRMGMRRAVVELFSLSRTKKVFGSVWSSFSHTACDIGAIPEITIRIKELI
jgi:hypothetical protein